MSVYIVRQKLLLITNHSYMLYQFRRELITELLKDHEVVISTPFTGHEEELRALGCRLVPCEMSRRGMDPKAELKLYKSYKKLIEEEQPDKVVTYSIKPNLYAGLICRQKKIPYFVNVQGLGTAFQKQPMAFIAGKMYHAACRKANAVFFENRESAGLFEKRKIVKKEQIKVLQGAGVNTDYYSYQAPERSEKCHFLYLGRIMKEKGIDELYSAVSRLHETHKNEFVLDLAGFYEDAYEKETEELLNAGIARFHGFLKDPRPLYALADCVVLPSWHEGMSNVLLEASSCGRMIVTSDIPGCREAVEDGKTGFLAEVKNADSLYEALEKVLALSREERKEMGRLGREKMEREFGKTKVVGETAAIIRRD